jgi:hypothetical protein
MGKVINEEVIEKNKQISSLGQQLFDTQTQLTMTQMEKDQLGQQLFDLQTELIAKGVL